MLTLKLNNMNKKEVCATIIKHVKTKRSKTLTKPEWVFSVINEEELLDTLIDINDIISALELEDINIDILNDLKLKFSLVANKIIE